MIRFRRKNTPWLIALGVVIAFALTVAAIPVTVQAALIGIFMLSMAASFVELDPGRRDILNTFKSASVTKRVSPQAREAAERVKGRGGYISSGITMIDLGLIAVQSGDDGIAMRRTRNISKDDDGVRPFLKLWVDREEAERQALLRFEIYDHHGEQVYIHEMKSYLRDGEIDVLADHHLPMAGNDHVQGTGDWDMRVYMDGNLIGMHNFMLAPSMAERRDRLVRARGEKLAVANESVEEEFTPTLEDLLSQKQARAENVHRRRTSRPGR